LQAYLRFPCTIYDPVLLGRAMDFYRIDLKLCWRWCGALYSFIRTKQQRVYCLCRKVLYTPNNSFLFRCTRPWPPQCETTSQQFSVIQRQNGPQNFKREIFFGKDCDLFFCASHFLGVQVEL